MKKVNVRAYGKVNLGLDVTGRRDDGYHFVRMVMQTVDVWDELIISAETDPPTGSDQHLQPDAGEKASDVKGKANEQEECPFSITLECNVPEVPKDSKNIAYKAAQIICREYGISAHIHININKNIPAAAGMAGGSADGAAVIKGLNELFALNMSESQMDAAALRLGADVPFCLRHGTYLAEGIGEVLTRIADLAHCYMVIIKPDFGISTPWAYKALDEYIETHCDETEHIHPDIDGLIAALNRGNIAAIAGSMGNILELVAVAANPQIQEIKDSLERLGAVKALMSGSGPTVFGIFENETAADEAMAFFSGREYGKFKVEF